MSAWQVSADQLQLDISGVSDDIAGNVRAFLSIAAFENQAVTSESRLRYLHRRAQQEIQEALEPFGYYNPDIETKLQQLDDGNWQAIYTIAPGPRVTLSRVNIQILGYGESDTAFQDIVASTSLVVGSSLNHQAYSRLKNRLQSTAAERGYYGARFERSRIYVNREDNTAEIDLIYATGLRTRIGEIRFSENPISENLLRRYPRFDEGDYIDVTRLIDLQSALIDSNYFADVEVLPQLSELEEGEVPIQVSLTARPRTLYRAGLGYGTDTGARLQLGMDRRYVNSRGHRMSTNLRLSEIRNDITGSYLIPGSDPRFDQYGIRGRYSDESSNTIDSQTYAIGGIWQKQVGAWERVLTLDLEHEEFTFDNDKRSIFMLIPRARFSKVVADDLFNTRKGHNLGFGVAATSESLLSDVSLLQLTVNGKRVDPLGDNWRLLSRFEVGATYTDSFDKLPASMRFYAGGDNSVRGYDYQKLGPVNENGRVIGGQYLMVGSVEADYMFRPDWRLAAFVDAGNAFDNFSEPVKTSAGVGVRWQSPVGPIRLDLAKPIEDSGFRIHFTLGPDL